MTDQAAAQDFTGWLITGIGALATALAVGGNWALKTLDLKDLKNERQLTEQMEAAEKQRQEFTQALKDTTHSFLEALARCEEDRRRQDTVIQAHSNAITALTLQIERMINRTRDERAEDKIK